MRVIFFVMMLFCSVSFGQRRLYSEAWGGGSITKGAAADTNPVLIRVNTLNHDTGLTYDAASDTYSGGIEAAFEANVGGRGRFIVFEVSGVIDGGVQWGDYAYPNGANDPDVISVIAGGEITVFGQTAPKGGVTLYRTWISMDRCDQIIIMHLAVRPATIDTSVTIDDTASTGIAIGASRVFIGNCSTSWGGDKGLIISDWQYGYPMQNMTGQYNIVAESATLGFTVDGKNTEPDWSVAGDLAWYRNWFVGGNRTPNLGGFDGAGEIMNNFIWYQNACCKLTTTVYASPNINHIANYYKVEADRQTVEPIRTPLNRIQPETYSGSIYSRRNYFEDNVGVYLDGTEVTNNEVLWKYQSTNGAFDDYYASSSHFTSTEHTSGLTNRPTELTASQAKDTVYAKAGVRQYMDDDGYIQTMQTKYDSMIRVNWDAGNAVYLSGKRGGNLDTRFYDPSTGTYAEESNTRPAGYDTDNDGLADAWEIREFGDITSYSYADDPDGDGYLNIEEFVFQGDPLVNPDGGGGSPPDPPDTPQYDLQSSQSGATSGTNENKGLRLGTTKIKTKKGKPNN